MQAEALEKHTTQIPVINLEPVKIAGRNENSLNLIYEGTIDGIEVIAKKFNPSSVENQEEGRNLTGVEIFNLLGINLDQDYLYVPSEDLSIEEFNRNHRQYINKESDNSKYLEAIRSVREVIMLMEAYTLSSDLSPNPIAEPMGIIFDHSGTLPSGEKQYSIYVVTKRINGGDLSDYQKLLDKKKPNQRRTMVTKLVEKFQNIGEALDRCHNNLDEEGENEEILHRDIKLSNILLDEDYNPYLFDYGLGINSGGSMGLSEVLGTIGDMPVEQMFQSIKSKDLNVSGKSDQFSLAKVLGEIMIGESPLATREARNKLQLHKILENASDQYGSDLREDFKEKIIERLGIEWATAADIALILEKAFSNDPEKRFESTYQMICALSYVLNYDSEIKNNEIKYDERKMISPILLRLSRVNTRKRNQIVGNLQEVVEPEYATV